MAEHSQRERLQSLTTEAGRALRARAKRQTSLPIPAVTPDSGTRRSASSESPSFSSPVSTRRRLSAGGTVAAASEIEAPREERSARAMAKELKRLLAEDRRRGLGVGG